MCPNALGFFRLIATLSAENPSTTPRAGKGFEMISFIKWVLGIALGLAVKGQLKSATLHIAKMTVATQQPQISFGKFSRMLTVSFLSPSTQNRVLFLFGLVVWIGLHGFWCVAIRKKYRTPLVFTKTGVIF